MADDFQPPPWERFRPGTTFQEWDFNTGNLGPPDGDLPGNWFNQNPTADTPALIYVFPPSEVTWWNGAWHAHAAENGGTLTFEIPNWIDEEPTKWLWIQVAGWWPLDATPYELQLPYMSVSGQKGTGGDSLPGTRVDSGGTPGSTLWELWEIHPNPDREWITIFLPPAAEFSQVVIDTISFPAPGAIGAFGLAGLAITRRRR